MVRKTISVEAVKENANRMLRDSDTTAKDGRIGIFSLLERILFDTGNYHGFRHIQVNGEKYDATRRYYY